MDIKIFNKFMTEQEANILINYINNNLNKFESHQDDKYKILLFGKDKHHNSPTILSGVDEVKSLILKYFNKVINTVKSEYNYSNDLL